jgi:hypothetical protein
VLLTLVEAAEHTRYARLRSYRLLERALKRGDDGDPLGGDELERDPVHAIPKTGRLRAVGKDVPKVTSAAPAMHLGADQEEEAAVFRWGWWTSWNKAGLDGAGICSLWGAYCVGERRRRHAFSRHAFNRGSHPRRDLLLSPLRGRPAAIPCGHRARRGVRARDAPGPIARLLGRPPYGGLGNSLTISRASSLRESNALVSYAGNWVMTG